MNTRRLPLVFAVLILAAPFTVAAEAPTVTGTWQGGGYSGELKAKRRP